MIVIQLFIRAADISPLVTNEFVKYYPDDFYARDATGRTSSQVRFHAELRRGKKTFCHVAVFFMGTTDDEVEKKSRSWAFTHAC